MREIEGNREKLIELLNKKVDVNYKNDRCNTALILASRSGYLEIVEKLLEKGANVCYKDESYKTALDYMSEHFKNSQKI